MPAELKPLFRPEALRPKLAHFALPPAAVQARPKLSHWTTLLASDRAGGIKETELLPQFIADVFLDLLGCTGPATGAATYTLRRRRPDRVVECGGPQRDAHASRSRPP